MVIRYACYAIRLISNRSRSHYHGNIYVIHCKSEFNKLDRQLVFDWAWRPNLTGLNAHWGSLFVSRGRFGSIWTGGQLWQSLKGGWSLGSRLQPNRNGEMGRYEKHNNICTVYLQLRWLYLCSCGVEWCVNVHAARPEGRGGACRV